MKKSDKIFLRIFLLAPFFLWNGARFCIQRFYTMEEKKTYFTAKNLALTGIFAALAFGVSLLVSLMVARKNKKIDMVEALKGAE